MPIYGMQTPNGYSWLAADDWVSTTCPGFAHELRAGDTAATFCWVQTRRTCRSSVVGADAVGETTPTIPSTRTRTGSLRCCSSASPPVPNTRVKPSWRRPASQARLPRRRPIAQQALAPAIPMSKRKDMLDKLQPTGPAQRKKAVQARRAATLTRKIFR